MSIIGTPLHEISAMPVLADRLDRISRCIAPQYSTAVFCMDFLAGLDIYGTILETNSAGNGFPYNQMRHQS